MLAMFALTFRGGALFAVRTCALLILLMDAKAAASFFLSFADDKEVLAAFKGNAPAVCAAGKSDASAVKE